jgi:hypothetical protein
VWFFSGTTRLMVVVGTEENGNNNPLNSPALPLNQESIVTIKVVNNNLSISISGGIAWSRSAVISPRATVDKATFWASDPWYNPAKAEIRNVSYKGL